MEMGSRESGERVALARGRRIEIREYESIGEGRRDRYKGVGVEGGDGITRL